MLKIKKIIYIYIYGCCRDKGPKSHNRPWALYGEINHVLGEDIGAKRAPGPVLVGQKTSKGQSEEKCLLGHDKYGLNMHFAHQKDPPNEH